MNKEFIPYEQALALKELGFDEPCLAFYDGKEDSKIYYNSLRNGSGDYEPFTKMERLTWFGAPLYQQSFRWFRENHGLHGIQREWTLDKFSYEIKSNREGAMIFEVYGGYPLIFMTYEEAELACLNRLIEIVKNK